MFLVQDKRHGTTNLVFTGKDPRLDGYAGEVIEDVSLDYDAEVNNWRRGQKRPEVVVGRATKNSKRYKVFKYSSELQASGYEAVAGTPVVFFSWKEYAKLRRYPEQLEEDEWFELLDELDEDSRRRRQLKQAPDSPAGKSRDEVAAWLAKKHFISDSSIREVWYLPRGAPPDQIRFLELNDRHPGFDLQAEALDFGLAIEGQKYHLLVADITTEQLERIKENPALLPVGWSLEGTKKWRRGA